MRRSSPNSKPAEEERGVLLAKDAQVSVRADCREGLPDPGRKVQSRRLTLRGEEQQLQRHRVVGIGAQVPPGVGEEELQDRLPAGEQNRDDRESLRPCPALQR